MCYALLGARADWVLIGAWNPMLWPIWGFRHTGIKVRSVNSMMRAVDTARKKLDEVSLGFFLGKARLDKSGKPVRGPAFTFGELAVATKAYITVAQVGHHHFLFLPSPLCSHRHHTFIATSPS